MSRKIGRGGSWYSWGSRRITRCACLGWSVPGSFSDYIGFRLVKQGCSQRNMRRILRGGSWGSDLGYCRCASRTLVHPVYFSDYIGFRLVKQQVNVSNMHKVLRGGAFSSYGFSVRCAFRRTWMPHPRHRCFGFRLTITKRKMIK